jgi:endoglucanase
MPSTKGGDEEGMMRGWFLVFLSPSAVVLADDFKLNSQQYYERHGVNVMVGQDYYPEGHQGGVSIIMHDERIASNGDVRLEISPGQWSPIPKPGKREVDAATQEIRAPLAFPDPERHRKGFNPIEYPDLDLAYTVRARPDGEAILVSVDFAAPIPKEWVGRIGFNLELFPGLLFGKTYRFEAREGHGDGGVGVFPRQPNGPGEIPRLGAGHRLDVAGETGLYHLTLESLTDAPLEMYDGRGNHNNGWFIVRSLARAGATRDAISWRITPHAKPDWIREPVIQVSQVGYHADQPKQALIELDPRDQRRHTVKLLQIGKAGLVRTVREAKPQEWGRFLRYHYLRFDFSDIRDGELYQIRYGEKVSHPFRVSRQVFSRDVWQPTLEYFLPAQMCHMKVLEKYRLWHGACHLDDARMAPVDHNHFDGYLQGPSTLTRFKPGEPVPNLARGGWHDAGDWDLRVESQADTIYGLALARELFAVDYDNTTVDQKNLVTEIRQPDGKNDVLQQVEHGVLSVLGGYEALGRLYRGIIEPTLRQYVFLGDGALMTDNVIFDPKQQRKGETPPPVGLPGSPDDRWVFTEENPRRELQAAAALAAASRVLRGYDDDLSARSLKAAVAIYSAAKPKEEWARVVAAVELLLATRDDQYRRFLISQRDAIAANIERIGWAVGRTRAVIDDAQFHGAIEAAVKDYARRLEEQSKETPYGVPYKPDIWGAGWNIQRFGWDQWMLHLSYPDVIPRTYALQALSFILGVHPGSNNASFVSGVGANSLTTAYGYNRADWSYIPGGSASGTALIRPDFPELKHWPYFWQQTEYVLGRGTTDYLLLALAADHVLNR